MTQAKRKQKVDDTHRDYYKNNPDYIPVNVPIEEFIAVLEKSIKKAKKTTKS